MAEPRKAITYATIAERARCSDTTVGGLLRGDYLPCSITLKRRVLKAIQDLGYEHEGVQRLIDDIAMTEQDAIRAQKALESKPKHLVSVHFLARKTGYSVSTIYAVISAQIGNVSINTVKKVVLAARKYGYKIDPDVMEKLTVYVFGNKQTRD